MARRFYRTGPYLMLKAMHYRPYICPFEAIIPHVRPGASVLDVGSGAGIFLAMLAGTLADLNGIGFDSSAVAIETALRMTDEAKLLAPKVKLRFLKLSAAEPWPEGRFDVVSLLDVLHHVHPAQQESVFKQAAQHLAPNGTLIYKDMADSPAIPAAMNRLHDLLLARQWIQYAPIQDVERWGRECHLTLSHSEDLSRLWYHHQLRVFRKPPPR